MTPYLLSAVSIVNKYQLSPVNFSKILLRADQGNGPPLRSDTLTGVEMAYLEVRSPTVSSSSGI